MQQTIRDFERLEMRCLKIQMDETTNGTSKYIYINSSPRSCSLEKKNVQLGIKKVNISFPYMLYEKKSCRYGGVYTIDISSPDLCGDEVLSLCNPRIKFDVSIPNWKFSLLIIHYEHYSGQKINFEADLDAHCQC